MTGAEHYATAERLRERAIEAQNAGYDGNSPVGWKNAEYYNAAAQVHATLALAAATAESHVTAWNGDVNGANGDVARAWSKAIS